MDWKAFYRNIDAQIEVVKAKEGKPRERRQQQMPVAVERRSGKERRGGSRALRK